MPAYLHPAQNHVVGIPLHQHIPHVEQAKAIGGHFMRKACRVHLGLILAHH